MVGSNPIRPMQSGRIQRGHVADKTNTLKKVIHTESQTGPQDRGQNVLPSIRQCDTIYVFIRDSTRPVWPGRARPSNHILSSSSQAKFTAPATSTHACNHRPLGHSPSPPCMCPPLPIPTPSICSWMTSDLLNKGKCILGLGGLTCKAGKAFDY